MRKKVSGFVTVRAISGTYVVFLAFDMKEADAKGLMGFAIQRSDLTENETIWLRGNKTFASIRLSTGIEDASSHEHPFQAFQWADYAAKPGYTYKYKVIPMYGVPGHLTEGAATSITIDTEPLTGGKHDVHFNRGAIASQAFSKRFLGMTLGEADALAYAWLARDLLPGLLGFIAKAKDSTWNLHAAIYEMKWPEVLAAFKAAKVAGADVKVIYHPKHDDTGSAKFSETSINTNDKNMALMHGEKRLANIYFGEFKRAFAHHRFRESVKKHIEQFGSAAFSTWKPHDLFADWKKWVLGQFKVGSKDEIKREYFCGVTGGQKWWPAAFFLLDAGKFEPTAGG